MRLGSVALGGSVRKHQCGCQGSAAGQQRGKAGQRGSSAGRSGCASSSVVIEAAAAFIQLQWPLRWIAASAAESAALAAGAKLLAVLMGGAPEEPGRAGFNPAGGQPGGSGFREGGRAGFNPAGRGGSTWRPHAYSTASEKIAAEMIQSLSKMPFSFTNNLFCCTTPNHVALVGEKKTSEARGERGEEQRIMRPASHYRSLNLVNRRARGQARRKLEKTRRKEKKPY